MSYLFRGEGFNEGSDISLYLGDNFVRGASPILRFVFEPVPGTRVVAGSYYNSPSGIGSRDSKAHHRCRGWLEAEVDFNIVASYHFSSGSSKILRGEASIIANDQASFIESTLPEIFCYSLSTDAHIIEGKIFGDNPAPPISTEFDWISHNDLFVPPAFCQHAGWSKWKIPSIQHSLYHLRATGNIAHLLTGSVQYRA